MNNSTRKKKKNEELIESYRQETEKGRKEIEDLKTR